MEKPQKNFAAVYMARLRKKKLTPERRSEIAKMGATARWSKKRKKIEKEGE